MYLDFIFLFVRFVISWHGSPWFELISKLPEKHIECQPHKADFDLTGNPHSPFGITSQILVVNSSDVVESTKSESKSKSESTKSESESKSSGFKSECTGCALKWG